jgi:hypothetical protein
MDETTETGGEDPEVLANEDFKVDEPTPGKEEGNEGYLWEESTDNPDTIIVYDNIIEAGTLNRLILWVFTPSTQGTYCPFT